MKNSIDKPTLNLFPYYGKRKEMNRSCPKNATRFHLMGSNEMDSTRKKRGKPKETWRQKTEKEMKEQGWTWGQIQ
jgi:hypothetical protein